MALTELNYSFVAQLIGFIGVCISLLIFQVNKRDSMLKLQMSAATVYALHFFLLGAFTGSGLSIAGGIRNYLFYKQKKRHWLLPASFIIVFSIVGILTWQGPISILPVMAMISGTLAFWQKNPKHIRLIALIASPLWLIYNLLSGSYPGILAEIVMLSSNLVGIYRFDVMKKTRRSETRAT